MRKTSLIKMTLFLLAILANLRYLIFILNPAHADNLGLYALTALADTIAITIFVSTWAMAIFFEALKDRYHNQLGALRLKGQHLLREQVAILITVVNEDLEVLRNTIQHALDVRGNMVVYILDDGKDPGTEYRGRAATRELAHQMSAIYITRLNNVGMKAGNLNNAIRYHVQEPYCIIVDADFALEKEFIQRTLPLLVDPRVAGVQTPQVYSSADTLFSRGCKHLQDLFYNMIMPGKHLLGSAFCVGTNVLFRTSALREVAGFPEGHSEDINLTLRLLERGYKMTFLNEQLAVGLSPTSLISFYTQQNRWARGGLEMLFRHNTLLNKKLTAEQKLQFFISNFFFLSGISVLIYLASPELAILLNAKPLSDLYLNEWITAYVPFFAMNTLFATALLKKHRLSALILGGFTFVPYLAALRSTLLIFRAFKWIPTNTRSKGLVTKLLAPYIVFLCVAAAIVYLMATGVILYNPALNLYYFWLAIDILIVVPFIFFGYTAESKTSLPHITGNLMPVEPLTEELVAINGPTRQVSLPGWNIADVQTRRMPSINGYGQE